MLSFLNKLTKRNSVLRGILRRCSVNKDLKNFAKFIGKHLCESLFFNKVAGRRPATSLKRGHGHRYFPVNITKFLKYLFYRTPPVAASVYFEYLQMSIASLNMFIFLLRNERLPLSHLCCLF